MKSASFSSYDNGLTLCNPVNENSVKTMTEKGERDEYSETITSSTNTNIHRKFLLWVNAPLTKDAKY